MRALDIMTPRVVTVSPDVTVVDVAKLLLERGISAVPVVDAAGRLLGIVSEGDLLRRAETGTDKRRSWWLSALVDSGTLAAEYVKSHARKARDVMTSPVITVTPDTPAAEIADLLEKRGIKRVPVVRDGRVLGIVSRANVLQALATWRPEAAAGGAEASDRSIRERLSRELEAQPWASPGEINILVAEGVVHLWGLVRTEKERDAIRVAAEQTPGVRRVENHLALRPVVLYGV